MIFKFLKMKGSINVHKREMFVIDVSLFLLGHVIVAVDKNIKVTLQEVAGCFRFAMQFL